MPEMKLKARKLSVVVASVCPMKLLFSDQALGKMSFGLDSIRGPDEWQGPAGHQSTVKTFQELARQSQTRGGIDK